MLESKKRAVLVSDFDGTMAENDFFKLVREALVPAETPDYWGAYKEGRLTHFEALRAIFAAARPDEKALGELVGRMNLDPELKQGVTDLGGSGWKVVVTSNGCGWYINRLLSKAGVDLEVHTNPGTIEGGRMVMHWPVGAPFVSKETGVDKAGVVRSFLEEGRTVAFAGDGSTDVGPAMLVPAELRFAREELADALRRRGEGFQPFTRWIEVARALVSRGAVA